MERNLAARSLVARAGLWQFDAANEHDEHALPSHNAQHFAANPRACCPVVATDQNLFGVITNMADLSQDDVLVDIGCGDGRFLAHAARTCRCRCIGLDVRPSHPLERPCTRT